MREELKDTRTPLRLMPGPTETDFFERAELMDTKVGVQKKDDPADMVKHDYEAMKKGEGSVVGGWKNKVQAVGANVIPYEVLAKQHAKLVAPGTADK